MTKYNNINTTGLQYPYNTLLFQYKYLKDSIAPHFPELLLKKTAKNRPHNKIPTKRNIVIVKAYLSPDNFTQLLV